MDGSARLRTLDRSNPRPADPPLPHHRDQRRELPPPRRQEAADPEEPTRHPVPTGHSASEHADGSAAPQPRRRSQQLLSPRNSPPPPPEAPNPPDHAAKLLRARLRLALHNRGGEQPNEGTLTTNQSAVVFDDRALLLWMSVHTCKNAQRRKIEFKDFIDSGRSLVVIARPPQRCYVATGQTSFSGTGINRNHDEACHTL